MAESKTEGKSGDEFAIESGADTTSLSQLLLNFSQFGTSLDFSDACEQFYDLHCAGFEEWGKDGEQKLEWTTVHNQFLAMVENRIEGFCSEHGVTARDVFVELEAATSSDVEFLPEFMRGTEFQQFCSQMHERAIRQAKMREASRLAAMQQGESKSGEGKASSDSLLAEGVRSVSGVWAAEKGKNNYEDLEKFLKESNCPWLYRKILRRASRWINNFIVEQKQDSVSTTRTLKFFGTTTETLSYDVPELKPNLWGVDVLVTSSCENGNLIITSEEMPYLPSGSFEKTVFSLYDDNADALTLTFLLHRSDRDDVTTYAQHFVRQHIN